MDILYFVFFLIPIAASVAAFLPELTGRSEPIPVGGFEYSIYAPKSRLILGAFGIGGFGVFFLLVLDGAIAISDERVLIPAVILFFIGEALSFCSVIFYFCYRLTVRGGTLFYKLPAKKELCMPISDIKMYELRVSPLGSRTVIMYTEKNKLRAYGAKTELLISDLRRHNIRSKFE